MGLSAVLERREGGYVARLADAPGVVGEGETGEDALEALERAALGALGRIQAVREPLSEEEAVRISLEAVREVREEMAAERNNGPLLPAPTPEEVRARRGQAQERGLGRLLRRL